MFRPQPQARFAPYVKAHRRELRSRIGNCMAGYSIGTACWRYPLTRCVRVCRVSTVILLLILAQLAQQKLWPTKKVFTTDDTTVNYLPPHASLKGTTSSISRGSDFHNRRPVPIVGFTVRGGVGNQIYDILEMLYLARQTEMELLAPIVLPRVHGRYPEERYRTAQIADHLWDFKKLSKGNRGRPVHTFLPPRCNGRFDILYIVMRKNEKRPGPFQIPPEVQSTACLLAMAAPGQEPTSEDASLLNCSRLFDSSRVELRRQNLKTGGDPSFLLELEGLRQPSKFRLKPGTSPLCIWISGHTFDRRGQEGDEYLYSHMHFLDANPQITRKAGIWPLKRMTALHIRYDEKLCNAQSKLDRVCVRVHADGGKPNAVYWASIPEFGKRIVEFMRRSGTTSIYVTTSPYAPPEVLTKLREFLGRSVKVEAPASTVSHDPKEINFLERELAIRSNAFIGDFGSTWSATVYYKRRTLGNPTFWSNALLGRAANLAYFSINTSLPMPE